MHFPYTKQDIQNAPTKAEKLMMLDACIEVIDDYCGLYIKYRQKLKNKRDQIEAS